eukprot:scaffold117839_cov13-Tisochrysis_lutea.AAC.1
MFKRSREQYEKLRWPLAVCQARGSVAPGIALHAAPPVRPAHRTATFLLLFDTKQQPSLPKMFPC